MRSLDLALIFIIQTWEIALHARPLKLNGNSLARKISIAQLDRKISCTMQREEPIAK